MKFYLDNLSIVASTLMSFSAIQQIRYKKDFQIKNLSFLFDV